MRRDIGEWVADIGVAVVILAVVYVLICAGATL